jgi:hypothetical protein
MVFSVLRLTTIDEYELVSVDLSQFEKDQQQRMSLPEVQHS